MLKNNNFSLWLALMLAVILMAGLNPAGALAQCGGSGSGYMGSMHDQHVGSSGYMGSGHMGQDGQTTANPNYGTSVTPPVSGYAMPETNTGSGQMMGSSGYGQMMGQGTAGSGHSGHMGTN
jgi:hypothetical protein